MFELEMLVAMGLGAALVAVAPVVVSVTGRESRVATRISSLGRSITKQGLKFTIRLADRTSGLASKLGQGLSEAGECFGDLMAEARADIEQSRSTTAIDGGKA